ncbi:50S ribosomal protein L28 [Proteiniborus sp. MB09-C3]|uniref:50S ribosomal protein L28 n=1 Tax=Proteiniborus sp. MB09-C3 TaxID=3050072 RepID=UPI002555AD1A|nr:50S ribosomal protein L28 [Proteiniborus sp. MB09-C3]WIV10812.1 50S ribosomal protein L28 [Proteiniborus sp. MB09-C3]
MAKFCEVCGKGKVSGHLVTFSNKKSNRTWSPNVRRIRAMVNGTPKRIYVCTRCIRSGNVERAL